MTNVDFLKNILRITLSQAFSMKKSMTNVKNQQNILGSAQFQVVSTDFKYIFKNFHISHTNFVKMRPILS